MNVCEFVLACVCVCCCQLPDVRGGGTFSRGVVSRGMGWGIPGGAPPPPP